MINFFRTGDYESLIAKRFLAEFRKSNIKRVELREEAYYIMLTALLTQDNLSYITVKKVQIDTYS